MLSQFEPFVRGFVGSRKRRVAILIVLAVLVFVSLQTLYKMHGAESKMQSSEKRATLKNFITHATAKNIPTIALQTADGTRLTLDTYRGELLLVNFWATWCAPCRKEMPQLDALSQRYQGQNMRVIALSVDRGDIDKPEAFLDDIGIAHLTRTYDPSYKSARAMGLIGLPTTLLIAPNGKEIGRLSGEADWNTATVHALVDYYLAKMK